jgi:hypothetical protein
MSLTRSWPFACAASIFALIIMINASPEAALSQSPAQALPSTSPVVGFRDFMAPTADAADPAITFSEYPVGTVITNQYASLGIIFSGGSSAGSPFITTDASNPTSPVLSGSPLFNGPIQGSFVDANGKPATVTQFQLDAGYF